MEDRQYLFGPKNEKDLKRQYPELGKESEFKGLTTGELLFVWWYANATSPLCTDENLDDKSRVAKAYEQAFSKNKDDDRKRSYYSFNFPDRIKLAIDKMRKFNPSIRIRSKQMVETIIKNYEELIKIDLNDFIEVSEDGARKINWSGRNSYVTSAKNISEALPSLIKQVEEGFGITDTKDDESGLNAIQRFHSTNTDK
jgi:hypothetical protein